MSATTKLQSVEDRNVAPPGVEHAPGSPARRAALGALLYVLCGAAWIAISDMLLHAWSHDPHWLTYFQTWKGWLFVLVTGILLFLVLHRLLRRDAAQVRDLVRQRAEMDALHQFRESIIENANIWISALDASAHITLWNKAAETISGYPRDRVLGSDEIWKLLYPDPDYRESVTAKVTEILTDGVEIENLETRIRCSDGSQRIISWNSRRFFDKNDAMGSITIGRDVTERKQMRLMLHARDRQLAILMANVPGMVYRRRHDASWTLRFVSKGCLGLTGYTTDDLIDDRGVAYASLIHPEDRPRIESRLQQTTRAHQSFTLEYRILHRDGQPRWVWEQGRVMHTADGSLLEGIIVNITDRKRIERQLERMAVQDPLTGLHNRRELEIALIEQVQQAATNDTPLTLLWIDIDRFKDINDERGHLVGDEVLRRFGHVILDHLRAEDMAARYGGDEFVILLPGMDAAASTRMAETIQQALRAIRISLQEGGNLRVTASMGLASLPEHASEARTLSEAADRAMYRAKRGGRDRICIANPNHEPAAPERQQGRPRDPA
jgi:diguanylate cyclase (GGDEF)-like protein/PAS domain S-box-containing protein